VVSTAVFTVEIQQFYENAFTQVLLFVSKCHVIFVADLLMATGFVCC